MRVLLSTYESHGDAEPMVGLAVQFDTGAAGPRDVMRWWRAA